MGLSVTAVRWLGRRDVFSEMSAYHNNVDKSAVPRTTTLQILTASFILSNSGICRMDKGIALASKIPRGVAR
jgi:hypothetical protein